MSAILDAAIEYINQGLSVIPLRPDDKRPLLTSWKELQTNKLTVGDVKEYWAETPNANVGIVTGKISGITVLDVDGSAGVDAMRSAGIQPPTPTTAVHSPNGYHYWYKYSDVLKQGAGFLEHVDIRNDGGYVVAPPSIINGKSYRFGRKSELLEWIDPPEVLWNRKKAEQEAYDHVAGTSDDIAEALRTGVRHGNRDNMATRIAGLYRKFNMPKVHAKTILLDFAGKCDPPLPEEDVDKVLESIYNSYPADININMGADVPVPLGHVEKTGDIKVFWADLGLNMTFKRPRVTSRQQLVKLQVKTSKGLSYGPYNIDLLSSSKVTDIARALNRRESQDWAGLLERAKQFVDNQLHESHSAESIIIGIEEESATDNWLLEPLVFSNDTTRPTILYSHGGTGKSNIALAVAMSVSSGLEIIPELYPAKKTNVLYLDWEADRKTHRTRVKHIADGAGLAYSNFSGIYHRQCATPIGDSMDMILEDIEKYKIGLVIVDSIVFAVGTDSLDASTVRDYNEYIRMMGCASLSLTHVTKNESESSNSNPTPYGNVFWHNFGRLLWHVKKVQEEDENKISLGLYHTKANYTKKFKPLGLEFSFTDGIKISRLDISDVPEFDEIRPLKQRIISLLQTGDNLTIAEISDELNVEQSAIKSALHRDKKRFLPFSTRGKPTVWGIAIEDLIG